MSSHPTYGSTARRADRLARRLGPLALSLILAGPALAWAGALPPYPAFLLVGVGLLLALVTVFAALVLLVRGPRRRALMPLLTAGLPLLVFAAIGASAAGHPILNDATTDPADPPAFDAARALPALADADLSFPPDFAPLIRQHYPDLAPLITPRPRAEVFQAALDLATARGWDVHTTDWQAGRLEAVDTSAVFRFADDVLVQLSDAPGAQTAVHMRSRSRVGRGDLGANAARIRAFLDDLSARLDQ